MKYKDRVMIFEGSFIVQETNKMINTYLESTKMLINRDDLFTNKVLTKKVLINVIRTILSDEFGINIVCDMITDAPVINEMTNLLIKIIHPPMWNMCHDIVGNKTIFKLYIDLIIMGRNLHIVTSEIKRLPVLK